MPDFNLRDLNGVSHDLYADLQAGNAVVLDFSAGWCPPCNSAVSFINQACAHYCDNAGRVKFYDLLVAGPQPGRAADSAFAHRFSNQYQIPNPVLTPDTNLTKLFFSLYDTAQGVPVFLIIAPDTARPTQSAVHMIYGFDSSLTQMIIDTVTLIGYDSLLHPAVQRVGSNLQTQPFASYQWLLNDAILPGDTFQSVAITQNGNYRVIVASANQCVDTSSALNVVNAGLDEIIAGSEMSLFPNPTAGSFTLQFAVKQSRTIEIMDATGNVVTRAVSAEGELQFALWQYPAGVYFVRVMQAG